MINESHFLDSLLVAKGQIMQIYLFASISLLAKNNCFHFVLPLVYDRTAANGFTLFREENGLTGRF